jgi:hypothetical protein
MAGTDTQVTDKSFAGKLISALDNAFVASKLSSIFKTAIHDLVAENEKKYNEILQTITALRNDLQARDAHITLLQQANDKLSADNAKLKLHVDELELSSKHNNLVFSGLRVSFADAAWDRESSSTDLLQQVSTLCTDTLNISTSPCDISYIYPLPSAAGHSPLVVAGFVLRRQRDDIYAQRKKLKNLRDDGGK